MQTSTLSEPAREQTPPQERIACIACIACLAVLVVCSGCATHVTLPAPPDGGEPHSARVAYCADMRPVSPSTSGPTVINARGQRHRGEQGWLELGDGTVISEPADLIPVVGSASDAGTSAREAANARLVASGARAATMTTFLLGASLLTLQTMPEASSGLPAELRDDVLTAGLAMLATSSLLVAAVVVTGEVEGAERRRAFSHYEAYFADGRCSSAHTPSASTL